MATADRGGAWEFNPIGVCGISPARHCTWPRSDVKFPVFCTLQKTLQSLCTEQPGWQSYMPRKQVVNSNKHALEKSNIRFDQH